MKKSMWIFAFSLLISVLGGAQSASPANSSPDSETRRMFFPRDMFWGWGQFDLAPPHNELDRNLCAGNSGQYGGANGPCRLFARSTLSGMLAARPFGRLQLRRFVMFRAPTL